MIQRIITARVRSTREGTVFTGIYLFTSGGRGRVPPSQIQVGGGTPSQIQVGNTHSQVQVGGSPFKGWGYYLPRGDTPFPGRGDSLPEQHSVDLLPGGQYASCVHAGGLSCLSTVSTPGVECEMKIRPMEQSSPGGVTIKQKKEPDVSSSELHSEGYETMTTSDLMSEVRSFSVFKGVQI